MLLKPVDPRDDPEPPEGRRGAWGDSPLQAQQEPALPRLDLGLGSNPGPLHWELRVLASRP